MKKLNILALLTLPLILASSVYAWDDCPQGEINDPYPGECTKYIDTDKNGICDHSEPAPEDRNESSTTQSNLKTDIQTSDSDSTESSDHDELYSVEISGQELKTLKIQELADLWKISSSQLLTEIINEFNLKGKYTSNSSIEDLREEYKFSPSQIKDIAQSILDGTSTNNNLLQTENNNANETTDYKELIGIILLTTPLILFSIYLFINKFFSFKKDEK